MDAPFRVFLAEAEFSAAGVSIGLLGGLSIFLFGMSQMTDGLKAVAGAKLAHVLKRFTSNRVLGAITGVVTTALVQSSSVTTVLLVGFITAGLMSLQQTVAVILGANVGSTVTAQLIAFNITAVAPVLITIGFGCLFVSKRETVRMFGTMLMGLGMIFLGMGMMSEATHPLRSYQPFIDLMAKMDNAILGILVSAAFTALIQSSAATTGIVIVLASQGFVSLQAGIALALGSNIGTCATAILAALGKPRPAVRVAAVHILFNVIGVVIWLPFLGVLADIVVAISPQSPELEGPARLAAETPRQVANAHTVFNVFNAALFLPFTTLLARLVEKLLPDKPVVIPERARPQFLDDEYLDTPAIAIERLRLEIGHLGDITLDAIDSLTFGDEPRFDRAALETAAEDAATLYNSILEYGARAGTRHLSRADAATGERLITAANNLQAITDLQALNMSNLLMEWSRHSPEVDEELAPVFIDLHGKVRQAVADAVTAVREDDPELAQKVIEAKSAIQQAAQRFIDGLSARLTDVTSRALTTYRIDVRGAELQQRIYYFAKRIAKSVVDPEMEIELDTESAAVA